MADAMNGSGSWQRGVTLLEVLVAIVVLSLGMLGLLGLMTNSMKLTSTSTYRAIATQHAISMAESVRGNAKPDAWVVYANPAPAVNSSCFSAPGCALAAMVNTEIDLWQKQLAASLPSGAGVICGSTNMAGDPTGWACTGSTNDPLMVKVCWDEARVGMRAANAAGIVYECIYTQI